jgi:phospholipase/carboxylesterase
VSSDLGFPYVYEEAGDPAAPTLLLLHGTGGDEHDLLGLGRALAPGAALLSPRGRVRENGMNRWFRRLGEGVFDVEDVVRRADELAAFTAAAAAEHHLDPDRGVAVGFSNGANIAAAMLLLHGGVGAAGPNGIARLRGAVLLAAAAPLQGREPDLLDLSGTSVFLAAGTMDQMIPIEQAELLATQLSDRGAGVTFQRHPGGHQVPPRGRGGGPGGVAQLPAPPRGAGPGAEGGG